ncbi:MAG: pyridoxamine 5'-phosphate oxidase family protein [Oscillospiraceae bacterium]|jgi:nitroimidazol reductase NimA-like FMN-containing flavoprotein (pyridoxamine 5'-phosphate oxidase superfamily)|nr:pyridoxamine 5'-phosphate oxidase family protein [Oscillospiraceae bacterium]
MSGFREIGRKKQALSREECVELLKTELRGVLSVLGDGDYPYGVPMDHWYCEEDGRLYFHSGRKGHKLDALRRCPRASFCVMDGGFRREGEWALNFRSVVVFGQVEFIEDRERIYAVARALSRRFTEDEAYIEAEIARYGPDTCLFCLVPEHITGKRVNEA